MQFRIKTVYRVKTRKTIQIKIDRDGGLIIRAPLRISDDIINQCIGKSAKNLVKRQLELTAQYEKYPVIKGEEGDVVYYRGLPYYLRFYNGKSIRFEGALLLIPTGRKSDCVKAITAFLKKRAREYFLERTAFYSALTGLNASAISISSAATRFGSCSGKNRISFSYKLILYPDDCIDYVVVHELCHTIHHDHSDAFWESVNRILPSYKEQQKWLKNNSVLLETIN